MSFFIGPKVSRFAIASQTKHMASQELSVAAEHNLVVNEKFEGGGWVRV